MCSHDVIESLTTQLYTHDMRRLGVQESLDMSSDQGTKDDSAVGDR